MGGTANKSQQRWILAATILGSSLAFLVSSVENVALPAIQKDLGATAPQLQWVINAYLLFLGALIITGGSAGDMFGRRKIFILGMLIFTGSSIWCALAPDITQLIIARGVQGLGGALQAPNSLAIISASFGPKDRGKGIGTWAAFSALTTGFGPVLGGWLVDEFSWRLAFVIIVPLAVLAIAITIRHVPESRREQTKGLDLAGMGLVTLGLGGTTYGLIASSELGWIHPTVAGTTVGGILLLLLFLWRESRAPYPMMPLHLFRSPSFTGANLITLFLYFALSGVLFFLPFNLIQVQGYSAAEAGASFLPFSVPMALLSRWAGGLTEKVGARTLLTAGPVIVAAGVGLLAVPGIDGSYWLHFFLPFLLLGLGMSLSVAPLTTTVMGSVEENHVGTASGINNAVARVAGLLAIAVLGVIVLGIFSTRLGERLDQVSTPLPPEARSAILEQKVALAEIHLPESLSPGARKEVETAVNRAFVDSFRWAMLVTAVLALAGGLTARLMIAGRDHDRQKEPHRSES